MNSHVRRTVAVVLLTAFLIAVSTRSGSAAARDDFPEQTLNRQYDWVIDLSVQELPHYLNYRHSTLHPVELLRVDYRMHRLPAENEDGAQTFQDLWYHDGHALGCKHYHSPPILRQQVGCLFVKPSKDTLAHSVDVANAMVRVLMELQVRDLSPSAYIVPADMYDDVVAGLNDLGFFGNFALYSGPQLSMHLISNPRGKNVYYFYKKKPE